MRVAGNAGGLFHLHDGAVVGVDSPGSPGIETLLRRSGRIKENDWIAALVSSVKMRSLHAALVGRGVIGSAEIQRCAAGAIRDGTFAVVVDEIERCFLDESADRPLLPARNGISVDLLLSETTGLLKGVAGLPRAVSPYRDRLVATDKKAATEEQWEIMALATGRRTARDLAFSLGRGLHPVTVEVSRMLGTGLLEIAAPATSSRWGLTRLRPRKAAVQDVGTAQPSSLPLRQPGQALSNSGIA
ncbi:hypothetical protein ACFWNN_18755 [Lentzea sp. NPDC058450]|uniref:hypothetical protein n=1 Tax=Lentzea sp. NPDC058450 TaxID=3346505 RepID=UPI003652D9E0